MIAMLQQFDHIMQQQAVQAQQDGTFLAEILREVFQDPEFKRELRKINRPKHQVPDLRRHRKGDGTFVRQFMQCLEGAQR